MHQLWNKNIAAELAVILLFTAGCSQAPDIYGTAGKPLLAHHIKSAIDESGLVTNLGIKVVSLETGKTIYRLNSENLFNPASNNKIFTAAAALHYLDSDYLFRTSIWTSPIDSAGHASRLVIKGSGDPDFSLNSLDSLAQLAAQQIKSVDSIIVDNTRLDSTRFGEGWMWDEGSGWYAAQIDAMTLNDNCIDIFISPGLTNHPPRITTRPVSSYFTINNHARTVTDTTDIMEFKIERQWWAGKNIFEASGDFLNDEQADTLFRNIDSPAYFTGHVLIDKLIMNGISVNSPPTLGQVSTSDILLTEHVSQPLDSSVRNFMKSSDNLTGELLVKTIGLETTGDQGNWDNGLRAVKSFLQDECSLDTNTFRMVDGSGVSRYNLASPKQLVQVLEFVYLKSEFKSNFLSTLPVAGFDGTLESRMKDENVSGKILAKTGTLAGVSCLSGYAFTSAGEALAFSIMMNGYVGSSGPFRRLQNEICTILANY